MKQATMRLLSAILALCLLLGCAVGASAASKDFGAVITISKMPTDPTFIPNVTEPDLTGLELTFKLGSFQKVLKYDDMYKSILDGMDMEKLTMEEIDKLIEDEQAQGTFSVWLAYPEGELKVGKNTFNLEISVSTANESYSNYKIPITLTGVALLDKIDPAQAEVLKAGLPNLVRPVSYSGKELALYAFTPKVNGWYSFHSAFSNRPRFPSISNISDAFFWFDPLTFMSDLFLNRVDPYAKLFDSNGVLVAEGDDHGLVFTSYDFSFRAQLKAGETYYLLPHCYGDPAPIAVTPVFVGVPF